VGWGWGGVLGGVGGVVGVACGGGGGGGTWGPSGKPRCMGPHGAAWAAWGRNMGLGMGPVQKKAHGRLLFAALALGQQPTGTAIKVPHPC
jgi:hypothetical protein